MRKSKSRFCRLHRKNNELTNTAAPAGSEARAEEAEAELRLRSHAESHEAPLPEPEPAADLAFEAPEEPSRAPSLPEPELDLPHVEEPAEHPALSADEPAENEPAPEPARTETLSNLLNQIENDQVDLENLKNLSITLEKRDSDLATLQSFFSSKLAELLRKSTLGEKCMDSLAPLCTGTLTECGPLDKLFSLGSGCLSENTGVNEGELYVPEKEEFRDPPTLPSGIKFVDDFNRLLDAWADAPSTGTNLFKLFNLSALLKHLGDPRYVEVLNRLGVSGLAHSPHLRWDEILRETRAGAEFAKHPLPELPNPRAVSNCTARLVDLPRLDNRSVDEHAFKLYWAYTSAWLAKTFGPSLRNHRLFQPTKNWYMNMERASQLFFLRLSRTLCAS